MYLSWSAFYEGSSDSYYFNVLIPRFLEEIISKLGKGSCDVADGPAVEFGIRTRDFDRISAEICSRRDEFHIIFVHSDLGGRNRASKINGRREALIEKARNHCEFDINLAVMLSPEKELEAWILADKGAMCTALGVRKLPDCGIPEKPREVERLPDPKLLLKKVIEKVSGRTSSSRNILVRVAQEQNFDELRRTNSFREFENSLISALKYAGFIE